MKIIALILIVFGIVIRYSIKKRKFNRRALTGVELFNSYEAAWITRLLETFIFWSATLMVLLGIFLLFLSYS
jgi:hypothetical protein